MRHNVSLDFAHFQFRAREFNGENLSREEFLMRLRAKFADTDIRLVKNDVNPAAVCADSRIIAAYIEGLGRLVYDMSKAPSVGELTQFQP